MSIKICDYKFEGPYDYPDDIDSLKDNTGVYVILENFEGKYSILDIGESSKVLTTIENHDRVSCWKKQSNGTLHVAVFYTFNKQPPGRKEIEQELRGNFDLPCGDK
ncbi:conserved hypothetical protein [Candidatus Desulfosporosinus infrequens]|uniref:Uncharacterized protein n=1 Tax=Candidatus Desulfosporosinus infrequens TaxID=2043169 RepID=A0A2U3KLK4_9FIRM|nr:conserved hypothetical protein [Candidatus Desulfosporosinus infrequens]